MQPTYSFYLRQNQDLLDKNPKGASYVYQPRWEQI